MNSPRLTKLMSIAGVALFAFGAAGVAVAKAPTKGSFQGLTSENIAVTFKVPAGGKSILNFTTALGYNGKCGQGGGPGFEINVKSIHVSHGKFSATIKGTFHASVVVKPINVKISGNIAGKKATGTVAETGGKNQCTTLNKGANPYSETFTASTK